MNKYIISLLLFLGCLSIVGCVAGGSGVFLEAKKTPQGIDVKLKYSAYGGANLRKLKTCEVYYGPRSSNRSTKTVAEEVVRKRDHIEWIANIPAPTQSDKVFIRSIFHTKELIGYDTNIDWIIKLKEIGNGYGNNGIE